MSKRKKLSLLCAATTAAIYGLPASGVDLVFLDASLVPAGPLAAWSNLGTTGGTFNSSGAVVPSVTNVSGVAAVQFNNVEGGGTASEYFVSDFLSPLTGNANRTIEVWAFNPSIGGEGHEESLVHNGRRGGPDGTNNVFGYGGDNRWGAHGAWGGPDMGWDGTPGSGAGGGNTAPPVGEWHQLILTYQNGHQRVYSDGLLENSENATLNTHAGSPLRIAAQEDHNNPGQHILGLNGAIARIRVSDAGMSAQDVVNSYNGQAAGFGKAARTTAASPNPRNRYSFTADASDSIGGAHGQVLTLGAPGTPASFSGGQLLLGNSGTDAANGSYVELPDTVLDGLTGSATLEFWGTWAGGNQWQRSVDLGGNSNEGGGPTPAQYVFIAPSSGIGGSEGNANFLEIKDEVGGTFAGTRGIATGQTAIGQEVQFVVTIDSAANQARFYLDGTLVNTMPLDGYNLDGLGDDNNWLGRSKFVSDALLSGSINEFRIYDGALTDDQVLGNFLAGPDNLNVPEPGSLAFLGLAGALLWRRRR